MATIRQWKDISAQFTDTLLLGNGASIVLDPCFSYRSLLDHARGKGTVTADVQLIFDHFSSTDFELVMRMLWHTYNVNKALAITDLRTEKAYKDLREALIAAVRDLHVPHENVEDSLDTIQSFMAGFTTVLSLNYDLIVYWAMLRGNAQRGRWFKDCWLDSAFEADWQRLREPYGTAGATLVFYPHGNLILASHPADGERKLTVGQNTNLLERVIAAWNNDDVIPMFVSEGESKQKEAAIARHGYLSTVYNDVMMDIGPSVAIYGWAMSENDDHILRRVCGRGVSRLAISVFRGSATDRELDLHCQRLLLQVRYHNPRIEVLFYDSASAECWACPPSLVP